MTGDRLLYSAAEAGRIIGVSKREIERLIRAGRLQAVQLNEGGWWRIRHDELERFVAELEAVA